MNHPVCFYEKKYDSWGRFSFGENRGQAYSRCDEKKENTLGKELRYECSVAGCVDVFWFVPAVFRTDAAGTGQHIMNATVLLGLACSAV